MRLEEEPSAASLSATRLIAVLIAVKAEDAPELFKSVEALMPRVVMSIDWALPVLVGPSTVESTERLVAPLMIRLFWLNVAEPTMLVN